MTKAQAQKVVDILTDRGIEARMYEDYSGRGMYGATCPGIVCSDVVEVGAAIEAAKIPAKDRPGRRDSLGLNTIVY